MQTVTGDIWTIGNHHLMCGDSTNPAHVELLMQGNQADLCFTSPPYMTQRNYNSPVADWDALMAGVFANLPMTPDGQVLVNLGLIHREHEWQPYWTGWIEWMRSIGWRRFGWYVWDKLNGMAGDWQGRLAPSFEFIFHFNKVKRKPNKTIAKLPRSIEYSHGKGMRKPNNIISPRSNPAASLATHKIPDSVIRNYQETGRKSWGHPAVFPVKLCEQIIAAYSDIGQTCYEPFLGSGSMIIACERLERRCMGMEISPEYCDIAIRRIERETGLLAFNQHGEPFDDCCGLIAPKRMADTSSISLLDVSG